LPPDGLFEGTIAGRRHEYHPATQDTSAYTTYFVTIRSAAGDFEVSAEKEALDTEPGTQVVAQVPETTGDVVFVRENGTVVDLRNTVGKDVGTIVFASITLLIALGRELPVDDYSLPRWPGFLVALLAAGGGVYAAFLLVSACQRTSRATTSPSSISPVGRNPSFSWKGPGPSSPGWWLVSSSVPPSARPSPRPWWRASISSRQKWYGPRMPGRHAQRAHGVPVVAGDLDQPHRVRHARNTGTHSSMTSLRR
jgi:hypothetical protein